MRRLISLLLLFCAACESTTPTPSRVSEGIATPPPISSRASTPTQTPSQIPARSPTATQPLTITAEVAAWLQQNALPLKTSADGNYDDLQPLRSLIGEARVVALGESATSTYELARVNQRISEWLVTQMGFRVLLLDASPFEMDVLDAESQNETGEIGRAVASIYTRWNTYELLDVASWIRRQNRKARMTPPVAIGGFDFTDQRQAIRVVSEYLQVVDATAGQTANAHYDCFRYVRAFDIDYTRRPLTEQIECQDKLLQVYAGLRSNRARYEAQSSRAEFERALQAARMMLQIEEWAAATSAELKAKVLARYQAENVRWVLERMPTDAKAIIWGHNEAIGVNPGGRASLGGLLREQFRERYVAIGADFYWGTLYARRALTGAQVVPAPPPNSYEQFLRRAPMPSFWLKLRGVATNTPQTTWLAGPLPLRNVPDAFEAGKTSDYFYEAHLSQEFDAFAFVPLVTPGNVLAPLGNLASLCAALPAQPRNLGFEEGRAFWVEDIVANFVAYEIVPDKTVKYEGMQSLRIQPPLSASPQLYRALRQEFRADAYRGQRVRVSAYIKSENVQIGLPMLAFVVSESTLAFVSAGSSQPISGTHDWLRYEVVMDVPDDERLRMGIEVGLMGLGQLWIDDVQIEAVSKEVSLTVFSVWPDQPSNLNFEDGQTGWKFNYGLPDSVEVHIDSKMAHRGRASAMINTNAGEAGGYFGQTFKADVYRGKRVRLSAYFKFAGVLQDATRLNIRSLRAQPTNHNGGVTIRQADDWQRYEVIFDVPADADGLNIDISFRGKGQLWVDDVELVILSESPE